MNGPPSMRMNQGFSTDPHVMRHPPPQYNPNMYRGDAFESQYFQEDWNNLQFQSSRHDKRHLPKTQFNPHNLNLFQRQNQRFFPNNGYEGNGYQNASDFMQIR
jgi:hypothetical protein